MPSDALLKLMNLSHRAAIVLSGGRVGRSFSGMPVVELTTTGRKTGRARTCLLTSPFQEGSRIYLVASRGGDDRHPDWFLNLEAHPEVTVSVQGGPPQPRRAQAVSADERARVWPLITARHRNYAGYQEKTDREIPLVAVD